jgi:hypothetical protein
MLCKAVAFVDWIARRGSERLIGNGGDGRIGVHRHQKVSRSLWQQEDVE